jgi:uncharacterized membrane protein YeiH
MENLLHAIQDNLTVPLGKFLIIDLIPTTNAFNGALLARRPTHYRQYTLIGIILLGSIAGIASGVVRGEWFVGTALLTTTVYIVLYYVGRTIWPASLLSVGIGFTFRTLALWGAWEEP